MEAPCCRRRMNCGARAVLDQNMAHPNDKDTDKAKINQNFNRLFDLVTFYSQVAATYLTIQKRNKARNSS